MPSISELWYISEAVNRKVTLLMSRDNDQLDFVYEASNNTPLTINDPVLKIISSLNVSQYRPLIFKVSKLFLRFE